MRYHLFQKAFGKMVKIKETSFLLSKCLVSIGQHCMISSNLFLLFNINYIKSWMYSKLIEIGFYSNERKIFLKIAGGMI